MDYSDYCWLVRSILEYFIFYKLHIWTLLTIIQVHCVAYSSLFWNIKEYQWLIRTNITDNMEYWWLFRSNFEYSGIVLNVHNYSWPKWTCMAYYGLFLGGSGLSFKVSYDAITPYSPGSPLTLELHPPPGCPRERKKEEAKHWKTPVLTGWV